MAAQVGALLGIGPESKGTMNGEAQQASRLQDGSESSRWANGLGGGGRPMMLHPTLHAARNRSHVTILAEIKVIRHVGGVIHGAVPKALTKVAAMPAMGLLAGAAVTAAVASHRFKWSRCLAKLCGTSAQAALIVDLLWNRRILAALVMEPAPFVKAGHVGTLLVMTTGQTGCFAGDVGSHGGSKVQWGKVNRLLTLAAREVRAVDIAHRLVRDRRSGMSVQAVTAVTAVTMGVARMLTGCRLLAPKDLDLVARGTCEEGVASPVRARRSWPGGGCGPAGRLVATKGRPLGITEPAYGQSG